MKRLIELAFCFSIILLLAPLLILIVILIKFETKGPAIFYSERVGINNTVYLMPKFRTMYLNTELVETSKLRDPEKKITRTGKILRKYSLDELPQFISVIFGKMAIIGPRPALSSQIELLQKRTNLGIHLFKPGITGYAQVNGRDNLSLDEKVLLESEYLNNKSFFEDLLILIETIKKIFKNKDVNH
tara:strand:- start:836 stop:1396 length:561 start_codon:yes stop_codon:yes gene_type:complete